MSLSVHDRRQAGFSLIELMVAMLLLLIVLTSVFSLMRSSIMVSTTTYEMTDAQQGLRVIQEYINRDLITAGDGFRSVNEPRLPREFVNAYLTSVPAGDYVKIGVVNSGNNVPANTVVPASPNLAASTVMPNTDRIVMLAEDADPNFPVTGTRVDATRFTVLPTDRVKFRVGEIYFITAEGSRSTFVQIKAINTNNNRITCGAGGNGVTELGLNTVPTTPSAIDYVWNGDTVTFQIKRVQIVTYFVNADRLLIRRVFGIRGTNIVAGGGVTAAVANDQRAFADSVIAEQVADLQFLYQIQQTGAGGNLVQPRESLDTSDDRNALRQVQVTPTTQTLRPITRRANAQTGVMENAPQQLTSTTTVGLRNLQFIRNSIN